MSQFLRSAFVRIIRRTAIDRDSVLLDAWYEICDLAEELEAAGRSTSEIAGDLDNIAVAVHLLVGPERFRVLTDILTTFDLFEAVPGLLLLAQEYRTTDDNLMALASLASAHALDEGLVEKLPDLIANTAVSEDDLAILAMYIPQLRKHLEPTESPAMDADLAVIEAHHRPRPGGPRLEVPIAVLPTPAFPDASTLRAMGDLTACGVLIRRLATADEPGLSELLSTPGVIVVGDTGGPSFGVEPAKSALWPDRVNFIKRFADAASSLGYQLDLERYQRIAASTPKQLNYANAILRQASDPAEAPGTAIVNARLNSWAEYFEQIRTERSEFNSKRDRVVRALAEALGIGHTLDLAALAVAAGGSEGSESADAPTEAAVAQTIGLYPGNQLTYISTNELEVEIA